MSKYVRYHAKNRTKRNAYGRAYYRKHRAKRITAVRKWAVENSERVRQTARRRAGLPEPTRSRPAWCECCGTRPPTRLDHDHVTGEFRGWLCNHCNLMLGNARNEPRVLENGARYLRDFYARCTRTNRTKLVKPNS